MSEEDAMEIIEEFDAVTDDPKVFSELMDEWSGLKKAELKTGSSEWTKVVVEAQPEERDAVMEDVEVYDPATG